jgi:PAS domain S-box-containing protein
MFNLDHFYELSPDLLCIVGFDGYFKKINPAVSKLLGYTEAELFEKQIREFIYPDDRNITDKNREHLLKNAPLLNYENRYIKKNGEIIWLSWTAMPVLDEQLVYAIAKNITQKKKQEEDRNLLVANLTTIPI